MVSPASKLEWADALESVFKADMTTIVGQGTHRRLAERAGLVHFDILPMRCKHVLLILLLVGKLQRTEATEKPMILLDVAKVVREASDNVLTMRASSVDLDVGLMSSNSVFLQFRLASKFQLAVWDRARESVVAEYVCPKVTQRSNLLATHLTCLVHFDVDAVGCKGVLLQLLLACKLELTVSDLTDPGVFLANVAIVVCETSLNCTTLTAGLIHPREHQIK